MNDNETKILGCLIFLFLTVFICFFLGVILWKVFLILALNGFHFDKIKKAMNLNPNLNKL